MKVFILEDSINRMVLFHEILGYDGIIAADNVYDGKRKFVEEFGGYDLILLDHDLNDDDYRNTGREQNNGTEFAKWMADKILPHGKVIIHSYNPDGAKRMAASLVEKKWDVTVQPFGMTLLNQLQEIKK